MKPADLPGKPERTFESVPYHSLRYSASYAFSVPDDSPILPGDCWELDGGRTYRIADRLSRPTEMRRDEALIAETDGLLDVLRLTDGILQNGLRVQAAVGETASRDVENLLVRARDGDANAMFHLGALHEFGDQLSDDGTLAEAYYRRAVQCGHVPAMDRLARVLGATKGWTPERECEARKWMMAAARLGHPGALYTNAVCVEKGIGGFVADVRRAAYLFQRARSNLRLGMDWEADLARRIAAIRMSPLVADPEELATRGRRLLAARDEFGGHRGVAQAIECLEHAASLGHAGAQFELAMLLAEGTLVPQDLAQAWRYFMQSATAGYPEATALIGNVPVDISSSPDRADAIAARGFALLANDSEAALPWLESAAVRWHIEASAAYAAMLVKRTGDTQGASRAWRFANFAAGSGHVEAMHLAAMLAASGQVPGIGDVEARHWLKRAVGHRHPRATYDWAWAHEHGLYGMPRNRGLAIYNYAVAGYAGIHDAYLRMGRLELEAPVGPERIAKARQAFRWALDKGLVEAQEEIDRLDDAPQPPQVDPEVAARGDLRDVFATVARHQGPGAWAAVFEPLANRYDNARPYFEQMRDRVPTWHPWPEATDGELVDLYCASRLNDLMLAGFQPAALNDKRDGSLDLTRDQYAQVWRRLGFEVKVPERFHPFWCEIVTAEQAVADLAGAAAVACQSDDEQVVLIEVLWPALHLGAMLFSRAGVRVRAPASVLAPDVAQASTLYWSWRRRNRKTNDQSFGWGHNSQWNTDFRRDFDLGDRYAYNVDVKCSRRVDLCSAAPDDGPCGGISRADRISFLRHRCLLTGHVLDADLYPFNDYYEEQRGS